MGNRNSQIFKHEITNAYILWARTVRQANYKTMLFNQSGYVPIFDHNNTHHICI